jgi:hypothetical protein
MSEAALDADREDLLRVLAMRFGAVPEEVRREIDRLDRLEQVDRLILVAANASSLEAVMKEMQDRHGFRVKPAAPA